MPSDGVVLMALFSPCQVVTLWQLATCRAGAEDAAADAMKNVPEGKLEAADISETGSVKIKFRRLVLQTCSVYGHVCCIPYIISRLHVRICSTSGSAVPRVCLRTA